jgi:hypothetical protein
MGKHSVIVLISVLFCSCSTLDQSLQLGGSVGALSGGVATYSGYSAGGKSPQLETVLIGAGIGAVLGLATSYFTHQAVVEDRRSCEADQIEMHFGDLPPSPFVIPKNNSKKGVR